MPEMFHVPVLDLSALEIFAKKIKDMDLIPNSYTLVTPDMGGIRRIKILSEMLENAPYATIEKNRDLETGHVEAANVEGKINETCFIVDDMISSGGTIIRGIDALLEQGAKKIFVFATHPVFSEKAPKLLQDSKADKIFVTDSLPLKKSQKFEKLEILSIAPLLAKALTREYT
jgi:ribose-phosphate pyrophosphokinase